MKNFIKLVKNSKGATAIEYGLIAALIAVAGLAALGGIGERLGTTFDTVDDRLENAPPATEE